MTDDKMSEGIQEYLDRLREREEQRPERERLRRKGRIRNKYRLLDKWRTALRDYDGPGSAKLYDEYRPSGFQAPVDVPEIAGLIVWDAKTRAHHFRLYRDETVSFIESPDDPEKPIKIDPMIIASPDTIYVSDGPPPAVTERLDALEVTPKWADACHDGAHEFERMYEGTPREYVRCRSCGNSRAVLSWLGHAVPTE